MRPSRRALSGAPQDEVNCLMALRKDPHPEEPVKRASRRTHSSDPADRRCSQWSRGVGEALYSAAPAPCEAQRRGAPACPRPLDILSGQIVRFCLYLPRDMPKRDRDVWRVICNTAHFNRCHLQKRGRVLHPLGQLVHGSCPSKAFANASACASTVNSTRNRSPRAAKVVAERRRLEPLVVEPLPHRIHSSRQSVFVRDTDHDREHDAPRFVR